jgi:hypothetical protein
MFHNSVGTASCLCACVWGSVQELTGKLNMQLFEVIATPEEGEEEAQLVDGDHAAALFMAALKAANTDIAALKASSCIKAKALLPAYCHSKLQTHAAKTGLDQLL